MTFGHWDGNHWLEWHWDGNHWVLVPKVPVAEEDIFFEVAIQTVIKVTRDVNEGVRIESGIDTKIQIERDLVGIIIPVEIDTTITVEMETPKQLIGVER